MKTSLHDLRSLVLPHARPSARRAFASSLPQQTLRACAPMITALALLLALTACSTSPPSAPQPDESKRRPANDPQAIELQRCRGDLQHSTLLLKESQAAAHRANESAAAASARLVAMTAMSARQCRTTQPDAAGGAGPDRRAEAARNPVYTIRFATGSATVAIPPLQAEALAQAAADAPLIMLRGRTDGQRESLQDDRLARERAEAVRAVLVRAGIAPARIRATWQGAGDHAVDNDSAAGRELNRRVEVEIYRNAPIELALPSSISTAAADAAAP